MKPIIAAIITCAVLFGVSFAASTYFSQPTEEVADEEGAEESETGTEDEGEEKTDEDPKSTLPPNSAEVPKISAMPIGNRPQNSISLEAVLQMSHSIKQQEERLLRREQKLAKDEKRIQMLFSDIATEQDELQAFSEGVDAKVQALEQMTLQLQQTLEALDARKSELAGLEKKAGLDPESQASSLDNKVNDIKGWFSNLEPEQAADYLKEFANSGKLEFAASLLHKMPDRQKSKILSSFNDPVLVSQLVDALKVKPKQ